MEDAAAAPAAGGDGHEAEPTVARKRRILRGAAAKQWMSSVPFERLCFGDVLRVRSIIENHSLLDEAYEETLEALAGTELDLAAKTNEIKLLKERVVTLSTGGSSNCRYQIGRSPPFLPPACSIFPDDHLK
jgi:hypothetical protein